MYGSMVTAVPPCCPTDIMGPGSTSRQVSGAYPHAVGVRRGCSVDTRRGPDGAVRGEGRTDMDAVEEVLDLFSARGDEHHGEVVDQRRHALQCAAPGPGCRGARLPGGGRPPPRHRAPGGPGRTRRNGVDLSSDDDHHEALGARWVAVRFGAPVARPIALHVVAKRYRCTVDPGYLRRALPRLPPDPAGPGRPPRRRREAMRFESHPGFADALTLRRWDEAPRTRTW